MSKPFKKEEARKRTVTTSRRFTNKKKKMPKSWRDAVDAQICLLLVDHDLGELKTRGLREVRVHKFTVDGQLLLIAYRFRAKEDSLDLVLIGTHENFYRELQSYLDAM